VIIFGAKALIASAVAAGAAGAAVVGETAALHRLVPGHRPPAAAGPTTLTREIDRATKDPHVRFAMRVGALLEGGSLAPDQRTGRWPCGDSGWTCGPYQIHRRANPGVSVAESQDPRFAVAYMLPRYAAGCASVPAGRWRTDPADAAAVCAYRAERPARMYPARRVDAAWKQLRRTS
jgi:hypothetical protein